MYNASSNTIFNTEDNYLKRSHIFLELFIKVFTTAAIAHTYQMSYWSMTILPLEYFDVNSISHYI